MSVIILLTFPRTCNVVLMVIVGEGHGVECPGGPPPVTALLIVITTSVHVLAQVVYLLVPVEVPANTQTEIRTLLPSIWLREVMS
jgi:hypothetical protein